VREVWDGVNLKLTFRTGYEPLVGASRFDELCYSL
jgi:hypothetical protein